MLQEVCGAGSRCEPGAATRQPDTHGLGRQELEEMVREVFQPPGPPRKPNLLVQGVHAFVLDVRMLLEVCGAKGAATCHTTTGKVKIKTIIPVQGSLHASVTPRGSGYNTCGAATRDHGGVVGHVGPVELSQGSVLHHRGSKRTVTSHPETRGAFYTTGESRGPLQATLTPRGAFYTTGRSEGPLQANVGLITLHRAK
jgi:hypothetical protein